jgi:hypothetical protein
MRKRNSDFPMSPQIVPDRGLLVRTCNTTPFNAPHNGLMSVKSLTNLRPETFLPENDRFNIRFGYNTTESKLKFGNVLTSRSNGIEEIKRSGGIARKVLLNAQASDERMDPRFITRGGM